MNKDQNSPAQPQEGSSQPAPVTPVTPPVPAQYQSQPAEVSTIKQVEKITVWVMVFSAILFAVISILAIWGVFSEDGGDIVGKSLGTLAVIAFTALVVNIGANMLEGKKK